MIAKFISQLPIKSLKVLLPFELYPATEYTDNLFYLNLLKCHGKICGLLLLVILKTSKRWRKFWIFRDKNCGSKIWKNSKSLIGFDANKEGDVRFEIRGTVD